MQNNTTLKLYDSHTHSQFSPDSRMTMDSAIKASIRKGLGGIVFTDHYDVDPPPSIIAFDFNPEAQQLAIDNIRERYCDFDILKGIEVGVQKKSLKKIESFVSRFKFDTIIASVHFVNELDPYFGDYYKKYEWHDAYRNYLLNILECITEYDNFDVVGHFDYIVRYSPYKQKMMRYVDFADEFESIFKILKERGKALEINTNTYRAKYGEAPKLDSEIIKKYRESGGELITLCSDAHDDFRIAENFEKYIEIIKEAGFKYITHFKERKPILTKI